jgi:hypothetical protein
MARFVNTDLNRLTLHSTLQQLAWSVTDAFSAVFLYRQGLELATIYRRSPPSSLCVSCCAPAC